MHTADSNDKPWAQKPAIIPVKTSPLPALASAELPVWLINILPFGIAITDSWPFNKTIQSNSLLASQAHLALFCCISCTSTPKSLDSSSGCGVITEFSGKEKLFVDFLKEEVANGVPDSYPVSWRYIKEGVHSLERHTNLYIYFDKNPYQ